MHINKAYKDVQSALKKVLGEKYSWYGNGFFRPGPAPKFKDIEVIALSLTAEYLSIDSEADLFKQLEALKERYFPNLICRRQYHDRRKKLKAKIEELRVTLSEAFPIPENIFIVDSTPAPVCRVARGPRNKIGKKGDKGIIPWTGYCAAQQERYFGYKLHAISSTEGIIRDYQLTPANYDDRKYLKQDRVCQKFSNTTLVGDMGYLDKELKPKLLQDFQIDLQHPYRKNMKGMPPLDKSLAYKRKKIETIFSQLKYIFRIKHNLTKSYLGFTTRMISKLCSLNLFQYINKFIKNKSIGNIKNTHY